VLAVRWGAVGFGLLFAAPAAFRGSYAAVLATAVCLFVTTYRTMIPVRPGATDWRSVTTPFVDVVAVAAVVGADGGVESPYFFVLLATIIVVTLGWGGWRGLTAAAIGVTVLVLCTPVGRVDLGGQFDSRRDLAALMVVALAVAGAAFLKARLEEADRGRSELTGEVTRLSEANDLLVSLTRAARSLPGSLSLRDTVEQARRQLRRDLEVDTVVLLTWDEPTDDWTTRIADGCVLASAYSSDALPGGLAEALRGSAPVVVEHRAQAGAPPALQPDRSSGVYAPITSRGRIVGVVGLEHPDAGHFDERRLILLSGLTDVLGLGIDNARWFARLRTLGAEEERSRIARELHDRLGQWLTYISMELDQIGGTTPSEQVARLRGDVNSAIDDLRYTLSDLRASIDDSHPLAVRGAEMTTRFTQRTGTPATFTAPDGPARVAAPVETELLRILQEALSNVDRHAAASAVLVDWRVGGGDYELTITDDGRGFDLTASTRDSAYGLVGMRERADVIGARLRIESTPTGGTTVRVTAGPAALPSESPTVPVGDGPPVAEHRELRP
jgi:signal transduction histidine kinase